MVEPKAISFYDERFYDLVKTTVNLPLQNIFQLAFKRYLMFKNICVTINLCTVICRWMVD